MLNPPDPKNNTIPAGPGRSLDSIQSYTTMVSPIQAQHILSNQMWALQRDIRPSHVAYLVSVIETGEMRKMSMEFAELPDGHRWLVDGQHRLRALIEANISLPCAVTVTKCQDEDAVGRLYLTIDRQTTRDARDGFRALGLQSESHVSPTTLARIGRAALIADLRFSCSYRQSPNAKSLIARTETLRRWLPEGQRYAKHLEGSTAEVGRLLWRAAVAAVGLVTLRESAYADDFWSRMAAEDALNRDDPRARLLAWLRANRVSRIGSEIVYAKHVAAAWNAYLEGRTLKLLKLSDPSSPVKIVGTTYGAEG